MIKDETGKRYGRLLVVQLDHRDPKHGAMWLCKCDCGCTTVVKGNRLRRGKTRSCGCLKREAQIHFGDNTRAYSSARMKIFNKTPEHRAQARQAATIHGGTGTRLFRIWDHMRERCNSTKGYHARWYHDKGIRVCEEWENSFVAFRTWAEANGYVEQPKGTPYKELLSIDRIDPMKGYCPENCRWISISKNSYRRNHCNADQR